MSFRGLDPGDEILGEEGEIGDEEKNMRVAHAVLLKPLSFQSKGQGQDVEVRR